VTVALLAGSTGNPAGGVALLTVNARDLHAEFIFLKGTKAQYNFRYCHLFLASGWRPSAPGPALPPEVSGSSNDV
jgi:hypothetical protein